MANFKFVIGYKGKSYKVEKDQKECPILDKKIGDTIHGDFLGLAGYELAITGGSDKDGFPMRRDVEGSMKRRLIVTEGVGFSAIKKIKKKKFFRKGYRKRKMMRGNTITHDVSQINCAVTKEGAKTLEDIFGKQTKEESKEAKETKEK